MLSTQSKITQKDFDVFHAACRRWIRKLGLAEWTVTIEIGEINNEIDNFAEMQSWPVDRIATIHLAPVWITKYKTQTCLKMVAFHEVMHIVTTPLVERALVGAPDVLRATIMGEEHALIRRIQNAFQDTIVED